ncbi:protein indeterminate-domain 11-like isoform X2 [Vicia villosa]|uniref:protein indeterminate-domain 11-like isoform X2 n=1 Tax=Vicia villosa TaxID=3911 RepID=UPI00273AC49F|nr:protein indeterminate-domain 11-like isoform X2 [Vicia villosa]
MVKGLMMFQQQVVEENMSNLTSASGEASASSGNKTEFGTSSSYQQQHQQHQQQQHLVPQTQTQSQPMKKKRNLPGNPDPEAEVIAMSPKSLLAKNRFICEICNKGFQRDQNLQLHRRGHNLPWKLKQRTSKEIRKKVYVCPETSCVHHDPSRALGDLTGIKKHFCRKHGEKKWKCEKCSKKYAVQSDWKAHSKTCGTREYRCDCGTLFSRRDSFITHRAFCDALAEESARVITNNTIPIIPSSQSPSSSHHPHHHHHHMINLQNQFNNHNHNHNQHQEQEVRNNFPLLKKEQQQQQHQSFDLSEIPPWLGPPNVGEISSSIFSQTQQQQQHQENPNPNLVHVHGPTLPPYQTVPSPHMSATALLQKAAQMGATMNRTGSASSPAMNAINVRSHQVDSLNNVSSAHFGLNLLSSSREHEHQHEHEQQQNTTTATTTAATATTSSYLSNIHDVMFSSSSPSGFESTQFDEMFGGIMNPKKDHHERQPKTTAGDDGGGGGGGGNEGLTRDFLGLRPLSHSDILSMAGIGNCMNDEQNQSQKPLWQG